MILLFWYNQVVNNSGSQTIRCPTNCEKTQIMPFIYKGLVTKKYVDVHNHSIPYVIFNNQGTLVSFSFSIGAPRGYGGQWDKVAIGDSIYKSKGSLNLLIKKVKGDTILIEYKCDYGNIPNWDTIPKPECKDAGEWW